MILAITPLMRSRIEDYARETRDLIDVSEQLIAERLRAFKDETASTLKLLRQYDPQTVLARGYALVRGDVDIGAAITIERQEDVITAEVRNVSKK